MASLDRISLERCCKSAFLDRISLDRARASAFLDRISLARCRKSTFLDFIGGFPRLSRGSSVESSAGTLGDALR